MGLLMLGFVMVSIIQKAHIIASMPIYDKENVNITVIKVKKRIQHTIRSQVAGKSRRL